MTTNTDYIIQRYEMTTGAWTDVAIDSTEADAVKRLARIEQAVDCYQIIARTVTRTEEVVVGPIPAESPLPGTRVRIVSDYVATNGLTGIVSRYFPGEAVPYRITIDGENFDRCYFREDIEITDEYHPMTRTRLAADGDVIALAKYDIARGAGRANVDRSRFDVV